MPILTFVTPAPQKDFDLWIKKSYPDIEIEDRAVIDDHAVRWISLKFLDKAVLDAIRVEFKIDVFQTPDKPNYKLFLADMDSTIVMGETLDDMADMAGIGDKISDITVRAMRGELDFEQALTERVKMLEGMPASLIDRALKDLKLNAGAEKLLTHLKSKGIYCVLISGGFTQFTSHVTKQLGFDAHFGNELIINGDKFAGTVTFPILDKNFKVQKLVELQKSMDLTSDQIIAIGDGANDLPMLQSAGLGVAYHGKPLLRDALINRIDFGDLSSLIYAIE
jgi:phosphoserine phosphatase